MRIDGRSLRRSAWPAEKVCEFSAKVRNGVSPAENSEKIVSRYPVMPAPMSSAVAVVEVDRIHPSATVAQGNRITQCHRPVRVPRLGPRQHDRTSPGCTGPKPFRVRPVYRTTGHQEERTPNCKTHFPRTCIRSCARFVRHPEVRWLRKTSKPGFQLHDCGKTGRLLLVRLP